MQLHRRTKQQQREGTVSVLVVEEEEGGGVQVGRPGPRVCQAVEVLF